MRLRLLVSCLMLLTLATLAAEDDAPAPSYGYQRIFATAMADAAWNDHPALSARLRLVRSHALKEPVVSNPASDRYMLTCYGGPVDLVHFLALAAEMVDGKGLGSRLYLEWKLEGGPENRDGFNRAQPPEAHPDDLPSNALGALFGWEIQKHRHDADFDLFAAFIGFVAPLRPLPDAVASHFSHRRGVMGLEPDAAFAELAARRMWFTAEPLVQCERINAVAEKVLGKALCETPANGEAALRLAGLRIIPYKGLPLIIRRIED